MRASQDETESLPSGKTRYCQLHAPRGQIVHNHKKSTESARGVVVGGLWVVVGLSRCGRGVALVVGGRVVVVVCSWGGRGCSWALYGGRGVVVGGRG